MRKPDQIYVLIAVSAILLSLTACGPTKAQLAATQTQIALEIFQTQTAICTPTFTPSPTFTSTPTFTPTPTDTPTPTPGPCSHVDLNGRYVDYREWRGILYGWVMDVEQDGCEIVAYEFSYVQYLGIGNAGKARKLTGTIKDDKVTVCYSSPTYCVPLVIFGDGQTLANGVEGWQYDKVEE